MYVDRKAINNYYNSLYGKDFPNSTLSKWKKEGRISTIPNPSNQGWSLYNMEEFQAIVTSEEYASKLKATKENPNNYIGTTHGHLLIVGIVPSEEKETNFKGTMMYCKCLKCNRPDLVQVRFSYLTPNGNYHQDTCGCGRKERAFLAVSRKGITEDFLDQFDDFEYYLFVHKFLTSATQDYYTTCDIIEYENAIKHFYFDSQLKTIYSFWQKNKTTSIPTFYDWSKPSLDHIVPRAKGGLHTIDNLQALTVFENLAKRDMTWEEWVAFKRNTNTQSDYFLENIIKGEG